MRGKQVTIPFRGMNNQLLDDQSMDGLCDSMVNVKPKGAVEQPYWAPFEKINVLKNGELTNFTYEYGLSSITDAFWQVRNFIGEFSEDTEGSLKRLLVLCQNETRKSIDIIEPTTWAVVTSQALPEGGIYAMSCTRLDQVTIINITRNQQPFILYYLMDDVFVRQGWPEMPKITLTTTVETFTTPEVEAGDTMGVLRKDVDQWFLATWAFRLFDGSHVRHAAPNLVKVDDGVPTEGVVPVFTLNGYSAEQIALINMPFWKGLIAGISVCCTIPRQSEKEALDDGSFFEVGYWPNIDKTPESEWLTDEDPNILQTELKSDSWPAGKPLGIDNYTHHRYCARVVDTYNIRLLLGGSAVDFALPKIQRNGTEGTIPGGAYTEYMDFDTGLAIFTNEYYDESGGTVADSGDPDYFYEINRSEYDGEFSPKSGREFKTVEILETSPETGTINPPSGGSDFPNATFSATIGSGNLVFAIDVASTNFDGGTPYTPWMKLKVTIGPTGDDADETIYFTVSPLGNIDPIFNFSTVDLEADDATDTAKVYHRITIKTDSGTYYRILSWDIAEAETHVVIPEMLWYPDRRAIRYELIVQNGEDFELALSKQLTQHPESNYSYTYLTEEEQTYLIGDSEVLTAEPDMNLNTIFQYIQNRIQASFSGTPFLFDPAASYRVGNRESETVLGFGVNINKTNEGQAGQFPLYAFSNKGIWALEQTGDPTIAFGKITPVSNFNGINNPYALTNAGQMIVCTDNKYIYVLTGMDAQRIDEDIANDPDYEDYLKQIRIGYHRAKDYEEVIFSNPFYDYSLCYNLKYKVWYKATERFKFFFYDYPELMGLTVDNVLKDFSSKDTESPVAWSLTSRVIQYNDPYSFKRMYPFYVRMRAEQPLQENEADYLPVRVQFIGYRDTPQMIYNLYDLTIKSDKVFDPRIYTQFGSMYAFRVIMSGTNNHKNGNIKWLDTDVELRYMETRRRNNCSAQFLYALGESSISICHCEGGGTDAYFPFEGPATESIVITHNLMKVPSRPFVTDLDGHLIECGVQLILTEGVPSLTQIRLTFEDPIPFKAYFN